MTELHDHPHSGPQDESHELLRALLRLVLPYSAKFAEQQRTEAELAAQRHVCSSYAATLGSVLEQHNWTGSPAQFNPDTPPSAHVDLGHGLHLHHTVHTDDQGSTRHVLTLIAPCDSAPGCRGATFELRDQDDLIVTLADLHTRGDLAAHGSNCTS
ncbi:hypothetical protein OG453_44570 [Streptomyces sp. NBC_01381]|uniref:hypothetical protein n=1 Tax=Streptomyces sp. NBC_01381 TaxID=2903845 RepID=UPI002258200F|nr:hypothetical protein [Streptomyces sp. NBC_01381]MCX4673634.1 hypothetical protein [Streptomyces sp. NBC_01381]